MVPYRHPRPDSGHMNHEGMNDYREETSGGLGSGTHGWVGTTKKSLGVSEPSRCPDVKRSAPCKPVSRGFLHLHQKYLYSSVVSEVRLGSTTAQSQPDYETRLDGRVFPAVQFVAIHET